MRRRSSIRVAAALLVSAALLVGVGLLAGTVFRNEPVMPETLGVERGPPMSSPRLDGLRGDAGHPSSSAVGAVRVRVLAADTQAPIPDAHVVLVRSTEYQAAYGAYFDADVLQAGTTDETGTVSMEMRPGLPGLRVFAQASGHVPGSAAYENRDITLSLQPGVALRGVVEDLRGGGVAGVEVTARPPRFPVEEVRAARSLARATTGSTGAFTVEGLERGPYELEVRGAGWALWGLTKGGDLARVRVDAPGENVVLRVQPIRAVAVRFLEAGSDVPLRVATSDVQLVPRALADERAVRHAHGFPAEGLLGDPSVHVRCVTLGDVVDVPGDLVFVAAVPGYRAATVSLVAFPPTQPGRIDEVVLDPHRRVDRSATLVVKEQGRGEAAPSRHGRALLVWGIKDSGFLSYRGVARGEDDWVFEGLPRGDVEVKLTDGQGFDSGRVALTLVDGENQTTIEYATAALAIDPRDAEGRRLADIDHYHLRRVDGWGRPFPPDLASQAWDAASGTFRPRFVGVEPGAYTVSLLKVGYGWTSSEVEVGPRSRTVLRIDFRTATPRWPQDPKAR